MCEPRDDLGGDVGLDGGPWFRSGGSRSREEGREIAWLYGGENGKVRQGGIVGYDCNADEVSKLTLGGVRRWHTFFNYSVCSLAELVGVHACGCGLRLGSRTNFDCRPMTGERR